MLTFPGAYDQVLSFILGLGGRFAVIYGAAVAGSEWSWGMLKAAVARGESRIASLATEPMRWPLIEPAIVSASALGDMRTAKMQFSRNFLRALKDVVKRLVGRR